MNHRRFASHQPASAPLAALPPTLGHLLPDGQRLPLDLSVSLAVEVVDALVQAHQRQEAFGRLTAAELMVMPDGTIGVTAPAVPGADETADNFNVGAVLYQLFTGVTVKQARAQVPVSPLYDVPPASTFNPAIDESIERILTSMLDPRAERRPHSLRQVEVVLAETCDLYELEPSREAIARWANATVPTARAAALTPQPQAAAVSSKKHVPSLRLVDFDDGEDDASDDDSKETSAAHQSSAFRFDSWTLAACAFCVVAFVMAVNL